MLSPFNALLCLTSSLVVKWKNDAYSMEDVKTARERMMEDLKSLTSRRSKLELQKSPSPVPTLAPKFNCDKFLHKNPSFINLYSSAADDDSCMNPITKIVAKVGPMSKYKMLLMLHRHPMLMYDVLHNNVHDLNNIRDIHTQLVQDLNLGPEYASKLKKEKVIKHLFLSYRSNTRSIISFLSSELQMSDESISKMILKAPQLLRYSYEKITSVVTFFISQGLDTVDVQRMITLRPTVLTHSIENKLIPSIQFFQNYLSITEERLFKVLSRYPQVFSVKVDKLVDKANFIKDAMGLDQWHEVSYVISMFPPVLWLSEDNLSKKVAFLKNEFQLDSEELTDIILTYPQVLGLGVEQNLRPKLNFLLDIENGAGLTPNELKEFALYQPALLAYSLDGRIRPRITLMKEHSITFAYSPPHLMSFSNSKFNEWLNTQTSTWSIK